MSERFATIVVDPPWNVHQPPARWGRAGGGANRGLPYPPMTVDDIANLRLGELADPDECHLYLWTINRYVEAAYRIVRGWGFTAQPTLITWTKKPQGLGPGDVYALTTEHVLFVRRGGGRNPSKRHDSSWFAAPRRAHSAKPECFLDVVEAVSPAPRLEVFARRARLGWSYAGDQSLGTVEVPGLRAPGEAAA